MESSTDWNAWHADYADANSALSRRLRVIQQHIADWLNETAPASVSALSVCAGDGRDLIDVLGQRRDAARVSALLVEADEQLVARATARAAACDLPGVTVSCADAGRMGAYMSVGPADLVLLSGVFGNISDDDVRRTIDALPQLMAAGGTLVWTRHRKAPDLTPLIRQWLEEAGFSELSFTTPQDVFVSVGVHRFGCAPVPKDPAAQLFTFMR